MSETNGTHRLTREEILAAEDIAEELVTVSQWKGGAVLIRGLTAAARDDFEASCIKGKGRKAEVTIQNMRAKLVALSAVDEAGERLFTEQDVAALGRKSGAALARLYEVAARLSGITDEDLEELKGN